MKNLNEIQVEAARLASIISNLAERMDELVDAIEMQKLQDLERKMIEEAQESAFQKTLNSKEQEDRFMQAVEDVENELSEDHKAYYYYYQNSTANEEAPKTF